MDRSESSKARLVPAFSATVLLASCTFTGLGNYDVETCAHPVATTTVQQVGPLGATSDVRFMGASGSGVIGAFVASVTGGTCIQGIDENGYLDNGCSFLTNDLTRVPRQPGIVPMGGGRAAVMVATSAPCTQGQILFRYAAPGVAGAVDGPCTSDGAALPSVVAPDAETAVVAYYATPHASREDAISDCGSAKGAPLMVASVTGAAEGEPRLGAFVDLADDGVSLRPPAMLVLPRSNKFLVAAPHGDAAAVWTLDASLALATPAMIPEFKFARTLSMAAASDGSGRVAIVAEIGCAPQAVELAVGDGTHFPTVVEVAPAGSDLAVDPTVAWVGDAGLWLVSWISSTGGGHTASRWYQLDGSPLGGIVAASVPATTAAATSGGDAIAFLSSQSVFLDLSVGCAPLGNQ
jgi:hypothetical protein